MFFYKQRTKIAHIIFVFLFLLAGKANAQSSNLVFSEIAAFESNDAEHSEWIEIYNRSNEVIDITGWSFTDSSGDNQLTHEITIPDGVSPLISPSSYAIIANNVEKFHTTYPLVTAQVFDSAWSSLNESGEYLALLNDVGTVAESFTYGIAREHSLERVNLFSDDYTSANWLEHPSAHTAGSPYSTATSTNQQNTPTTQTSSTTETIPSTNNTQTSENTTTTNASTGHSKTYGWGSMRINEFVSDPEQNQSEWIELYNTTNEIIDLSGWNLSDGSQKRSPLQNNIAPLSFSTFNNLSLKLNNDGDEIILLDQFGFVIDKISYGNWTDDNLADNSPAPQKSQSAARIYNGKSTMNDASDFALTTTPTKNSENHIVVPAQLSTKKTTNTKTTSNAQSELHKENDESPETENPTESAESLLLSELFPNPSGVDTLNEFIELYNPNEYAVSLDGWQLADTANRTHTFTNISIEANSYLAFTRAETKISMNNTDAETINLIRSDGSIADTTTYDDSPENDWSYSRENDEWLWSTQSTPGTKNLITTPNFKPVAVLNTPDEIDVGESILLDAQESNDPENNTLTFTWSFGDRTARMHNTSSTIEHIFETAGTYHARVYVSDGFATSSAATLINVVGDESNDAILNIASSPKNTKPKNYTLTTLQNVEQFEVKKQISVEGEVLVQPGILSSRALFIGNPGIELYMHTNQFPELKIGDRIRARGELSQVGEAKRIKLKTSADITLLEHTTSTLPIAEPINLDTLNESMIGDLLTIEGEVISKNNQAFIVQNTDGELSVVIKEKTNINSLPTIGDHVRVSGILTKTSSEFRLLPRHQADILITEHNNNPPSLSMATNKTQSTNISHTTLPAMIGGVSGIALNMLWKQRGQNPLLTRNSNTNHGSNTYSEHL